MTKRKPTTIQSAEAHKRSIRQDVAAAVRAVRETLELSRAELGGLLGVSRQTVTTWETGGALIDVGTLTDWLYSRTAWVRDLAGQIASIQFGHFFDETTEA